MDILLIGAGVACLIAAIAGVGIKAAALEIGAVSSPKRQALLALLGIALLSAGWIAHNASAVRQALDPAANPSATTSDVTPPVMASPSPAPADGAPPLPEGSSPGSDPGIDLRSVSALPAGLFCRDLIARGYSYGDAVAYWRLHGQPERMDADKNGVPCETVYPLPTVVDYYQVKPTQFSTIELPPGLLCRDLKARGVAYPQAVAYWVEQAAPARMDSDGNNVPCETVYPTPDVQAYWGN